MIVTANARLAISVKATKNSLTGAIDLESVILPVDFNDILTIDIFGPNFMDIVHYANRSTHIKEKPVVDRALNTMRQRFNYPMTFGVKITKNIPTGHGLGSGSSNAMMTIKAVDRLAKLRLLNEDITEIAKELGADLPFFALNKPAHYNYLTQMVTPIKMKQNPYVLIFIHKKIMEKNEVLALFEDEGNPTNGDLQPVIKALEQGSLRDLGSVLFNDFSEVIVKKNPDMQPLFNDLRNLGIEAFGIGGLGTTIFALSENKNLLKYIGNKYKKANYEVVLTKVIK